MLAGFAVIACAVTATLAADGRGSPGAGQSNVSRLPLAARDAGFVLASDAIPAAPVGPSPSPFSAPPLQKVPDILAVPTEPAERGGAAEEATTAPQGQAAETAEPARLPPAETVANPPSCCNACAQPSCICKPQFDFDKRELLRPLTLNRDGSQAEISVVPAGFYHKISADHMSNSMSALLRPFTMTNGPGGISGLVATPPGLRRGSQFAAARSRRRCIPALLHPLYLTNDGDLMEGAQEHRIVEYVSGLQTAITDWPSVLSEPFYATGAIAGDPVRNAIGLVAYQQDGEAVAADGLVAGGDGESLEEVPAGEGSPQDDKKGIAGDEKLGEAPE
ncbi:MAG: hypothetical protein OES79_06510, partial [Planctomycetota bacterium]|nr:hypothetical protein [Planctomycetota bacterium]